MNNTKNFKIGISSCLLGHEVRFDGNHKHDKYLTGTLANYFDLIPLCREVECGLPIPRESMRLVGSAENPALIGNKTGKNYTSQMTAWAESKMHEIANEDLCGFICKANSPSSGMEPVKIYDHNNMPRATGAGIFTRIFKNHFPLIPIEEEERLHDPPLRKNFIESVFVYKRWRDLLNNFSANNLVQFHTSHKLLLLAHDEKIYRQMGPLVAKAGTMEYQELQEKYQQLLMIAMHRKPTIKKHVNVLSHIMGYFKKMLERDEKVELLELIENFRQGLVPLIVPVTHINHYVQKYNEPYLSRQFYLNPHPLEQEGLLPMFQSWF